MGSESVKAQDPCRTDATQAEIAKTLAAEQALIDTLQSEVAVLENGGNNYDPIRVHEQACTDGTKFDLFSIPCVDLKGVGLLLTLNGFSRDAAESQSECQMVFINAVNKDGTLTTDINIIDEDGLAASSGTLAVLVGVTDDTNVLTVDVTLTSSLTSVETLISYEVRVIRGGTVTLINADA